jgi:hypothetical protein
MVQGEHYKVDLTSVDPENAAVKRTSSGDDSVHVEGMSKTKTPLNTDGDAVGSGFIKISSGNQNTKGASGPRTGETPAINPKSDSGSVNVGGSGSSVVGSRLNNQSRPGFL